MTPDETLQKLRSAIAFLMPKRDSLVAAIGEDYKRDQIDELLDAAAALDVWLSKGGWLPAAWEQAASLVSPDPFPFRFEWSAEGVGEGPGR